MSKQVVVTLLGGLPLGFRLSALKEDERFYAVSKIRQHSKAEKSGLQLGDVILCVNGIHCEDLSHVAVTALTDISDVLNLLVLRNSKNSSEIVAAFSNLGQSARRLTPQEIADLTSGNQNLTVTRRQSTGCISQAPLYDQQKPTPVKLFGNQKLNQSNVIDLPKTPTDSEDKKLHENGRISEKRRERISKAESGSQKRHLVPARLKNISQATEVLEKELEDEIRKELNLQMFEETNKVSLKSIPESTQVIPPNRNARCVSEEPRFKTNMQFKLSTDEIKKNQKVPVTQTKVSIRRFSLALPGEKETTGECVGQNGISKNKLNIMPFQMKPVTTVPISRRSQFSIRSNSVVGISAGSSLLNRQNNQTENTQVNLPTHDARLLDEYIPSQDLLAKKQTDLEVVNSPRITSSSTRRQVMPATRVRSNSLSVLSTARAPPSSKFERPINFSLSTGTNKVQAREPVGTILSDRFERSDRQVENRALAPEPHVDLKNVGMTVDQNHVIQKSTNECKEVQSETQTSGSQVIRERKLSFSSQSRALNALPTVKMPSSAIKIQSKSGSNAAKPFPPWSTLPLRIPPKVETGMSNRVPASPDNFSFTTHDKYFGTNESTYKLTESQTRRQQSLNTPAYYGLPEYTKKDEEPQFMRQSHDFTPFSGLKQNLFPSQYASKPDYTSLQSSNTFRQTAPYSSRQLERTQLNPLSSYGYSSLSSAPLSRPLLSPQTNLQQTQFSSISSLQHQTNKISSNPLSNQQLHDRYNYHANPRHSYQPSSLTTNPVARPLLTRFNVSSRGHQWHPSSNDRIEPLPLFSSSQPHQVIKPNQYLPYVAKAPLPSGSSQVPDYNTYLNQRSSYSTLPRNFKSPSHNISGFGQSESFSASHSRNIWHPSTSSSTDKKFWDHANTN